MKVQPFKNDPTPFLQDFKTSVGTQHKPPQLDSHVEHSL